MALQRWGGFASFLMAVTSVVAGFIYLTGNWRDPLGQLSYDVADFLYGPLWAASLVTAVLALRERIGGRAERRMTLAVAAAFLAAGAMVAVACIRAANRHYHLMHPELHLETASTVLIVWTTLVAGVVGTGWHFLGWSLVLLGWAGWTSRSLPRALCALYLLVGIQSLFTYRLRDVEWGIVPLAVVSIWQGIVLWMGERRDMGAPENRTAQPFVT